MDDYPKFDRAHQMKNGAQIVRALWILLGGAVGLPIGAIVAHYGTWLFCWVFDIFELAWLFITFAFPVGIGLGVIVGAILVIKQRRAFLAAFLPVALILVGLETTQYHLRRVTEPQTMTLEILDEEAGLPDLVSAVGKKFTGTVRVDGVEQDLRGTIPATFTFEASDLEHEFTIIDNQPDQWFRVQVLVNGARKSNLSSNLRIIGESHTIGTGWWRRAWSGGHVEFKPGFGKF